MAGSNRDYSTGDIVILLIASAAVGTAVWVVIRGIGLDPAGVWSTVAASVGYMILLMVIKALNYRHGRPGQSIKAMLAASVATGIGVLIVPSIWRAITGL